MNEMMILQAENAALKQRIAELEDAILEMKGIAEIHILKLSQDLTASRASEAALTARVQVLEDALKTARHRIWWIKTNVDDDCLCHETCEGCKIEIHEAVFTCRELLPSLDAALNSTPALDLSVHDEAVRRDVVEKIHHIYDEEGYGISLYDYQRAAGIPPSTETPTKEKE